MDIQDLVSEMVKGSAEEGQEQTPGGHHNSTEHSNAAFPRETEMLLLQS